MTGFSLHGWHFEGAMAYRLIEDEARGPWRVKTLLYRYRLAVPEHDVFRLHWHPSGLSPVTYPTPTPTCTRRSSPGLGCPTRWMPTSSPAA